MLDTSRRPSKVFLSYASADRHIAGQIAAALNESGLEVWDPSQLTPGSNWAVEIQRAIDSSDAVVFLMSGAWVASQFAQVEMAAAVASRAGSSGKRILPVLLDSKAAPPFFLRQYQYVDFRDPRRQEVGIELLKEALSHPIGADRPSEDLAIERDQILVRQAALRDLERAHAAEEKRRSYYVGAVVVVSITFSVAAVLASAVTGDFRFFAALAGPLVGILGGVTGFYFGRRSKE